MSDTSRGHALYSWSEAEATLPACSKQEVSIPSIQGIDPHVTAPLVPSMFSFPHAILHKDLRYLDHYDAVRCHFVRLLDLG